MSLVHRIKDMADLKKVSFAEVERQVGLSNGQIRRWDSVSPKAENLQKVADYFDTSVDYLLGRIDDPDRLAPAKRDFAHVTDEDLMTDEEKIEAALSSVMSYSGEPLTDNDREILKGIIEGYLKSKK